MSQNNTKIIRSVTVSGSFSFCHGLMIKMREMGYDMVAVSSPGKKLDELKNIDGFHCVEVPMERHISLFKDLKSLFKMIRVFRKEKPQIVHSMTPKAGLICMMAAWLSRVPKRIHTFTGLVWPTATGLKRKILMATDWITCACATHVIPEGQGVLNDLKNGGITRKPMKVLGYGNVKGIDIDYFNPKRFKINDNTEKPFTFLFVGRIVGDKGINELVSAFSKLYESYSNIKLVLVGNYEENLDPIQDTTKQTIDSHPAIEAVGGKYGDDLVKQYLNADCFVFPSYREGFPNAVLEAGAMGLPSIVTDINGSREIITDKINGLIIPSKNTDALYDAMKQIINDDAIRNEMKRNAREMIVSRFEKNFVQKCQIEFYEKTLKN